MRRRHNQLTVADEIPKRTIHPSAARRKVWDSAAVLQVLRVAKDGGAGDAAADGRAEVADGSGDESGALAVAAGHDGRPGALGGREVDQADALTDGGLGGATALEVPRDGGGVGTADTLDPETAHAALQSAREVCSDSRALQKESDRIGRCICFLASGRTHDVAALG